MNVVRRFLEWWPVERFIGIARCARRVRETMRFVGREVVGRDRVGKYHLRESGAVVHLRHRTPDFISFYQAFYRREFDLLPEVDAVLSTLGRPLAVLDLGANIGLFGAFVLGAVHHGRIVAFEPDPSNSDVLRKTIAANERDVTWDLIEACAATTEGDVTFVVGGFGQSRTATDDDAATAIVVPAVDVFPQLAEADLVKFDIEGSEWEILADPRFSEIRAKAIHFEYHARLCPEPEPREFAVRRLEEAGYDVRPMFESSPGYGVLWAWRPTS
jgi:FkbM family methyltransferase